MPVWASRSDRRDADRTQRVAAAALRSAGGHRATAAERLRHQAREHLAGAITASADGAGDERVIQLAETALRRIRAATAVERGEISVPAGAASLKRTRSDERTARGAVLSAAGALPRRGLIEAERRP